MAKGNLRFACGCWLGGDDRFLERCEAHQAADAARLELSSAYQTIDALTRDLAAERAKREAAEAALESLREPHDDFRRALVNATRDREDDDHDTRQLILVESRLKLVSAATRAIGELDRIQALTPTPTEPTR